MVPKVAAGVVGAAVTAPAAVAGPMPAGNVGVEIEMIVVAALAAKGAERVAVVTVAVPEAMDGRMADRAMVATNAAASRVTVGTNAAVGRVMVGHSVVVGRVVGRVMVGTNAAVGRIVGRVMVGTNAAVGRMVGRVMVGTNVAVGRMVGRVMVGTNVAVGRMVGRAKGDTNVAAGRMADRTVAQAVLVVTVVGGTDLAVVIGTTGAEVDPTAADAPTVPAVTTVP